MSLEGIDLARVSGWIEKHVSGVHPPLTAELIAGGHSNLTYRLEDSRGRALVLRRPPLAAVLESAHDMGREHRIVSALGPTDVPVAPVHGLCRDPQVNGAPFYLMEFVPGVILRDSREGARVPQGDRRAIGFECIDVLARLHRIEPDRVGLGDLGRREAYIARQLRRWSKQFQASKLREIPEMEAAHRLLEERMPEQVGCAIVHGDYRLGNMILEGTRIGAVLDWELCTLGDPLADLGYLLNSWLPPDELPPGPDVAPTAAGSFPTRDELLQHYAAATGRDVSKIAYYRAFQSWRGAAINEGVYHRYRMGAMGAREDLDLSRFEHATLRGARAALELLER
ncbi:MAG: phosphotransferase family protein [Myxococcota bacterium]